MALILLFSVAPSLAAASWADEIKVPTPAGLDQAASDLWNQTWDYLGHHFPSHELTEQQKHGIRVPLAESPGVFAQLASSDLTQLRSRLAELHSAADAAALVGEDEFFLRLVPAAGTSYAETVTVFDKSDHGVDGDADPGTAAGVNLFRVPSLCNTGHTLLAFSEARVTNGQESGQDCVPTGIAMKRSTDGGKTWGAISYPVSPKRIPAGASNGLGDRSANPTTVWEEGRGRVHLHYVKGARTASDCTPRSTSDEQQFFNFYVYSDDYGQSWSQPIDISDQLGAYRGCMPGPDKGVAVSLSSGETRIVVPCHLGKADHANGESIVYYSEDVGEDAPRLPKTWTWHSLGKGMDETTITVAKPPSTLLVSMRNVGGEHLAGPDSKSNHTRAQSVSTDGGTSWSTDISFPASLPDPSSEGSLCTAVLGSSHPDSQLVLLSNAPMAYARAQLSLHMTADVGRTWGPAMGQGGCIPVTDVTAADTTEQGGAKCRKLVDGATFSDYSSLWCAPQGDTPPLNIVSYGVLWGTCSSPFPFQVWCQRPDGWSVKFSRGNFAVRLQDAARKPGPKEGIEQEIKDTGSHAVVWVLCTVGACALFQFCRTFCRKRAVDGTVSDFMMAYTEDHRETLGKMAGGTEDDSSNSGLGTPLLAAPKGREIAASAFQATAT